MPNWKKVIVSGSDAILNSVTSSTAQLTGITNAGTDTDKFLVLDSDNNVDFRTGAQVLSDIGAGTGTGDITRVNITAGNGLSGTSVDTTSGDHTQTLTVGAGTGIQVNSGDVAIDYTGTDNFIDSATNLEGTGIATGDTVVYHDATDNNVKKGFVSDLPFNNYSHPNHTGDVTSAGDGATTIANEAVTNAKLAHMAVNTIKGRITAGTGDVEDLTAANVRSIINVEDGATADQTQADINGLAITELGTVTTGTWSADTIAVDKGGTGQTSYTNGQLLIGNTTGNTLTKAILSEGQGINITNGAGSIQIAGEDATATNKGIVELATSAETTTGTDDTRAVTPKALADQGYLATPSTLQQVVDQGATTTTDVTFTDSTLAQFGTGNDLRIYHNGSNSLVDNITGDLFITNAANDKDIVLQTDNGAGGTTDYLRADGSLVRLVADVPFTGSSIQANSITVGTSPNEYTFPSADGTSGQAITTDGLGNLSFSTVSTGGTTINNNADNRVITGDNSAGVLNAETNFTFDGSKLSVGKSSATSPLHVYQNDSETGTATGITVEQDGTGDAVVQYLLTGGQRWVTGVDNSDGDKFKIDSTTTLGSNNEFTIDTSGNVGIGTAFANAKLEVNGSISSSTNLVVAETGSIGRLIVNGGAASITRNIDPFLSIGGTAGHATLNLNAGTGGQGRINTNGTKDLALGVNGLDYLVLSGSAKILTLSSIGNNNTTFRMEQNAIGGTLLEMSPGTGGRAYIQTDNTSNLELGVNSTEYLSIIGTTGHISASSPISGSDLYTLGTGSLGRLEVGSTNIANGVARFDGAVSMSNGSSTSTFTMIGGSGTANIAMNASFGGRIKTITATDLGLGVNSSTQLTIVGTTGHVSASTAVTGSDFYIPNDIGSVSSSIAALQVADVANSSTLILSNTSGRYYTTSANSSTSYTTSSAVVGGFAYVKVNAASQPTVSGCKLISGSTFLTSTDMTMVVYEDGDGGRFYFLDR